MINENLFRIRLDGAPYSTAYCSNPELIENYDLAIQDTENVWICHHKFEAYFTRNELMKIGRYYNCKPRELIFCKDERTHHYWPHKGDIIRNSKSKGREPWNKGKQMSDEYKEKCRKNSIGRVFSESTRQKISEKLRGNQNGRKR